MGKLFAVTVAILTIVSAGIFMLHIWWLPPDVSVLGTGIDHQINETMMASGVLFVGAQLALAAFVWQSAGSSAPIRIFPGGATPMVVTAVVLVGIEVLVLTLVGSKIWAGLFMVQAPKGALQVDVQAEQFAFYFRYAGPDGKFGAMDPAKISDANNNFFGLDPANDTTARDDIISGSLAIPVNRPILLTLHSRDVGHAFYVPQLRIQQDFVPGLVIPIHFTATTVGKYELVCTQLCGLGHYNMRAYVEVMSDSDFAQWLKTQANQ